MICSGCYFDLKLGYLVSEGVAYACRQRRSQGGLLGYSPISLSPVWLMEISTSTVRSGWVFY